MATAHRSGLLSVIGLDNGYSENGALPCPYAVAVTQGKIIAAGLLLFLVERLALGQ